MSTQILARDAYLRQAKAELVARGYVVLAVNDKRVQQLADNLIHVAAQDFSALSDDCAVDFDPHAEHGDWVGPGWHICGDGQHRQAIPGMLGELPICDYCQVAYCAACDLEVSHAS